MPKTIFFDLDGTLTDSGPGIMNCASLMLDHYNFPYDEALLRTFIGPPLRVRLEQLGFSPEDAAQATKIFRGQYNITGKFENAPYPGMIDLLKTLKAQGHRLFVATSKPEEMSKEILTKFGLADYFEMICGATLDGSRGKKEDVIAYLLSLTQGTGEAVMVGDTTYDVIGAAHHGIPTIGVAWGYGKVEDMKAAGAKAIANTMEELLRLLNE